MKKTRQVIIVAGPAASGKTVLMQKIRDGLCPHLCEQLDILNPEEWQYTNAVEAKNLPKNKSDEQLIVHCDLYNQGILTRIHNLLLTADKATIITLCLPPYILKERNKKRIFKNLRWLLIPPQKKTSKNKTQLKKLRSLWLRHRRNSSEKKVLEVYNDWFDLLDQHSARTYWLDSSALNNPIAHVYESDRSASLQIIQS